MRTDPLSYLLGRKQTVGFNDGPLPMYPLWLDGIEPGAFRRESERQDTHPFSGQFDLLVVFSHPGLHDLADMAGSIIPDQQPGSFALPCQPLTAPLKKQLAEDGEPYYPAIQRRPRGSKKQQIFRLEQMIHLLKRRNSRHKVALDSGASRCDKPHQHRHDDYFAVS